MDWPEKEQEISCSNNFAVFGVTSPFAPSGPNSGTKFPLNKVLLPSKKIKAHTLEMASDNYKHIYMLCTYIKYKYKQVNRKIGTDIKTKSNKTQRLKTPSKIYPREGPSI